MLGTVLPFQTTDWGQHWYDFSIQGAHPDNRAFYWAHFALGDYLWLTTDGGGPDGTGPNIVRYNFLPGSAPSGGVQIGISGLKVWQCFFMAVTGQPGGSRRRIFLGAIDNGCLCSDDSGGSWTQDGVPPSGGCLDYPSLVFAPSNPDRAYSRTCNGASFGRTDNAFSALTASAVSWTEVMPSTSNDLPDLWTTASITVDPLNQDHVCFANSDNVAVSSTAGNSWTQHSLPGNAAPVCVFFNKNGDLYAGTVDHGAYKSADNGGTWSPFGLNSPAPRAVFKIAHSSAGGNEGTFFLAATSGLYRKLPGGVFTRQWGPNGVYTVSDVEVHPTNPMRVAIAMGYVAQYGQHRGGVLLSTDNGTTFTSITAGLDIHQAPITDIQFDPVDPRYIHAAVFGLGAWTAYAP